MLAWPFGGEVGGRGGGGKGRPIKEKEPFFKAVEAKNEKPPQCKKYAVSLFLFLRLRLLYYRCRHLPLPCKQMHSATACPTRLVQYQ